MRITAGFHPKIIELEYFNDKMLEKNCESLSPEKEVISKEDTNKSQKDI